MTKKQNRGLSKLNNIKVRHELYDQDYIDKLPPSEREWLINFNLEYINADFSHEGERLHKKVMQTRKVISTGKKRKYDVGKKDCQDRNNARNRDAFSVTKANKILENEDKMSNSHLLISTDHNEVEDVLIAALDDFNEQKNKK